MIILSLINSTANKHIRYSYSFKSSLYCINKNNKNFTEKKNNKILYNIYSRSFNENQRHTGAPLIKFSLFPQSSVLNNSTCEKFRDAVHWEFLFPSTLMLQHKCHMDHLDIAKQKWYLKDINLTGYWNFIKWN